MVEDTKMTDASASTNEKKKKEEDTTKSEEEEPPKPPPLQAAGLRLERLLSDPSYTNPAKVVRRWLTTSSGASAAATLDTIGQAAKALLDPCPETLANLASESMMETDDDDKKTSPAPPPTPVYLKEAALPFEAWLVSLAVRCYYKQETSAAVAEQALALAQQGIDKLSTQLQTDLVRSTATALYPLLARLVRWRALVIEQRLPTKAAPLRQVMAQAYNMATLRRDADTQATLLNCMLRDLLHSSQIEQAQKLLANSTFPETASNNQLCRYLYYSGRIQALRLEYTSAYSNLSQSLRKVPTNTGLGFRITVQRLLVVVQLLMGEIPDRHVFYAEGMQKELEPYLSITQAVRQGDLGVFGKVVAEHAQRYQMDHTYTLISRLAHQVVKAGLRNLHLSYSRLSLQDVADRLGLPSAESAELVVAKAVRDGVLDATIHHEEGYVQSHDLVDVYATSEPSEALHRRIAYCLTTHNDAVKGMRYPPDAYKKQLEASRGLRRRGRDDDEKEVDEDDLDDDDLEDY